MNRPASEITATTGQGAGESTKERPALTTPLRFVTAASLFDGHDAAINITRRLIQAQGCEVIHLGPCRWFDAIVHG